MENVIEINGEKYVRRHQEKKRHSSRLNTIMIMAAMFGGGPGFGTYDRKRPTVDLVKEFELIQQKKSNLSRSDRHWVEYQFKLNYTKI